MAHHRIGILAARCLPGWWLLISMASRYYAAAAAPKVIISFAGVNPRQTPLWIAQEQRLSPSTALTPMLSLSARGRFK